jgi:hypothetical protein
MVDVHYYETLVQEDINVGIGTTTKRNPGGGSLAGTQVGLHSLGVGQQAVTQTWDPSSVASLAVSTVNVTVAGAALGDFVVASFSLYLGGLILSAEVSAANTVTATLFNPTTSAIDLASGTLKVLVLKSK